MEEEPSSPGPQLQKGQVVYMEDYAMQPVRKEVKKAKLINIVKHTEPRLLTVCDGCLYVF